MGWGLADIVQNPAALPPPDPNAAPSYPVVPAHPSPDGRGYTNLSDADYAKFNSGVAPSASPAPAKTDGKGGASWGLSDIVQNPDALKTADNVPAIQPDTSPPPTQQDQPSIAQSLLGSTASALHGIPRGIVGGNTVDYVNAALQTPIRMMTGMQNPISAFNEGLDSERKSDTMAAQYPIANVGGEIAGGIGSGAAVAPALAFKATSLAPNLLQRGADVASYLGKNAAMGGLMSAANGGDATTGAGIGAGLAAALPVVGKVASLPAAGASWLYNKVAPIVSNGARETQNANTLGRLIAPGQIETSDVGPLDLAQATNSPAIADKVRYAQGNFSDQANSLRDAQTQAVRDQVGQIGAQASPADASSSGVGAIRDITGLTKDHERALWNVPALTDQILPTQGLKDSITSGVASISKDDPGLLLGKNSDIQSAIDGITSLPDGANLQNINSYIGVLKSVARRPPPENARAGALATRLLSVLGKSLDDTIASPNVPDAVKEAYQAARDYTRERSTVLGTQDVRSINNKNAAGIHTADASEALKKFFNFSNGSTEGPQNLQQLSEFAKKTKAAWLLGPNEAERLGFSADQLKEASRSYIASALTKAARIGDGQVLNPKTMQDFLRTNGAWLKSSGVLEKPQVEAVDRLLNYATQLRRTEALNAQGNSSTQARQETAKTFIDEIMSPWARRGIEGAALLAGGHSHGGVGALIGGAVGEGLNHSVMNAEVAMREAMASVVFNSRIAKDLLMKATPGNRAFLSPETRDLLRTLSVATQSNIAPQKAASSLERPTQVGH